MKQFQRLSINEQKGKSWKICIYKNTLILSLGKKDFIRKVQRAQNIKKEADPLIYKVIKNDASKGTLK